MADNRTPLFDEDGNRVIVEPESLPDASDSAKGAVKQGASVASMTEENSRDAKNRVNALLKNMRETGQLKNDLFVILYEPNAPTGYTDIDVEDLYEMDLNTYRAGDTARVEWVPTEKREDHSSHPRLQGHDFLGWSRDKNATVPEFVYSVDESEQQDYTVTFTNDDITLYAVWRLRTHTLTYSLGSEGTGSVPAGGTYAEEVQIQVAFSPAPTCLNDPSRIFAGWATYDGASSYGEVSYKQGENETIWGIYDDTTLYPVFVRQYSLTYSLGAYATGAVPSGGMYFEGQNVRIDFDTQPVNSEDSSLVFRGWATNDGSSSPDYSSDSTTEMQIWSDTTLYPVFGSSGGSGEVGVLTIDNTIGDGYIQIWDDEGSPDSPIRNVSQESIDFNFENNKTYRIVYDPDSPTKSALEFSGVYHGVQYSGTSCTVGSDYNENAILPPDISPSGGWEFYSGDGGTLTFGSSSDRLVIDNQAGSGYVSIIDGSDYVTLKTIEHNSSDTFNYKPDHNYKIRVHGLSVQPIAQYSGSFNGTSYAEQELSVNIGSSEGESYYDVLNPDNGEYIQFSSGPQSIRISVQDDV